MKQKLKTVCPHCQGTKVVRNGHKRDKKQVYRCKNCMKSYQEAYDYHGANPEVKSLASIMPVRGSGIRDIAYTLKISTGCVLQILASYAKSSLLPPLRRYHQIQVDELYSFVGNKRKKGWIMYAYCANSREILAVAMGKGNKKTVRELYQRLKIIKIYFWCTDNWEAFKAVFPVDKHKIGKEFTKAIEGVNTYLRGVCKRLIRRTTAFSKKLLNHWVGIKLVMAHRNYQLSSI